MNALTEATKPRIAASRKSILEMNKHKPVSAKVGSTITTIVGAELILICNATGIPEPSITWQRDEQQISTRGGYVLSENNRFLTLKALTRDNAGLYTCVASNLAGSSAEDVSLTVAG